VTKVGNCDLLEKNTSQQCKSVNSYITTMCRMIFNHINKISFILLTSL
jgi:hypothetical protein